jgi:hypothetical protein
MIEIKFEDWQVKALREYFGFNDKSQISHWAFNIFHEAYTSKQKDIICECSNKNWVFDESGVDMYCKKCNPVINEQIKSCMSCEDKVKYSSGIFICYNCSI